MICRFVMSRKNLGLNKANVLQKHKSSVSILNSSNALANVLQKKKEF